jgi:diguanylate cyclase (GGDEF)-like protein/PAS domain S-box-containing protein
MEIGQTQRTTAEQVLHSRLNGPPALIAAIADDGFRIPIPEGFEIGHHQPLPVPERATLLDVVVTEDRLKVVSIWERARANGVGVDRVLCLGPGDQHMTMTIIDAREHCGTFLGMLTQDEDEQTDQQGEALPAPLVVSTRPRTATAHKSMTAFYTSIDPNVSKMLGWTADDMIGVRSSEFIHPDDRDRAVAAWLQLITDRDSHRVRQRVKCQDGSWLWVEVEHTHNGAEDPDDIDVFTHITDISDEMAAHEAVLRREQLFRRLAESLPNGVLQVDAERHTAFANARLAMLLEVAAVDGVDELLQRIVEDDREPVDVAIAAALAEGADAELEVAAVVPQAGRRRWGLTIASVADQDGEPGALICVNDVTEHARMRADLETRATVDGLTGCLNRAATMTAVEDALMGQQAAETVVVFVDLDGFKPVNDHYGHAAGDELLTHVAARLRQLTRNDDAVGRFGGDEFLVVCGGVERPEQMDVIARRVGSAFAQPIALATGTVHVKASIGVARATPGMSAEELIAHADAAMYEAKRRGDGRPQLWRPELGDDASDSATAA